MKKNTNNNSIFNIYNELAVITFLREYGFSDEKVQELLKNLKITKSRYEDEEVEGYKIISYMTKGGNPVATSGVFDYVRREPNKKDIIMMIENIHDGEDWPENITWIYDTDFEFLKDENIDKIIIGGIRSQDYRIRCLLAGIPEEKIICDKEETETYKYLSLDKNKDIYVLFDLDSLDKLATLQQNIRNRIKEGK
jgi:UDP-N-acetylmuramyl tripeptide synthase